MGNAVRRKKQNRKGLPLEHHKEVLKNKKRELKKVIELEYGFLDQLVSQGTCNLEQVKFIEKTKSSTIQRKNIVKKLVEKLETLNSAQTEQILNNLRNNNQHHVAEFVKQRGRLSDVAELKPLDTVRKYRITRNMRDLVENLDLDNGLLREWSSKGCINHQQCRDIEQKSPKFRRNRKLLNFLLKRSVADYDLFVDCLKNCDQGYLAKLLDEQGDAITESASRNWKVEFEHLIELKHGFLDDLISGGLIEYEDCVEDIETEEYFLDQRGRLLDLMIKQSPDDILQFLEALRTTGQEHVANFITQNGDRFASDDELYKRWPLESHYESRITRNFRQLTELIEADVFTSLLNSAACINGLQKCDVDETRSKYDKARKLLYFLLQSSIANYEDFVERLKNTPQRLVAKILEKQLMVEAFISTISTGETQEKEIVDKWKHVRNTNDSKTINMIDSVLFERVGPGVEIVDIEPCSRPMRFYLLCRTPRALKSLYEKLENGSLNATMQSIFTLLLGGENIVQVEQTKGRLSAFELLRRVETFSEDLGADDAATAVLDSKEDMWSTYDVLEPLLLQVAVKLFKVHQLRLLLPRPDDITTLITVSSVCRDWWEVTRRIKKRKKIRQRLKLIFRKSTVLPAELFKAAVRKRHRLVDVPHKTSRDADVIILQSLESVCLRWKAALSGSSDLRRRKLKRPFHYNPQLLFTLNEMPSAVYGFPRQVFGVVMLYKFLYVVYDGYNKVEVFDYEDHCKKIKDFEVEKMADPCDMVGSRMTSQLFISEWYSDVIRRVNSKSEVSDVFIKTGYKNSSLALAENRLLVTSPDSLLMFDIDSGERMKEIPLTEDIKRYRVFNAIESNIDSFFVSHGLSDDRTVSEIDSDGRGIRTFDNKQQLHFVRLALKTVGCLLAADLKNCQIVLLDEQLKYERILIDKKRLANVGPLRLNYNKNSNRLSVGLSNGQVKIFEY